MEFPSDTTKIHLSFCPRKSIQYKLFVMIPPSTTLYKIIIVSTLLTHRFDYYIYDVKDSKYLTYVGITKDYDNMMKIQGFFTNAGYIIYVDNISVNNEAFSVVIDQYDQMLRETEDNQTIKGICSQVLAKYEELVVNSDSTN